ncbi:LysR family transcriptional regulator [Candidatus Sororendozoicomonas aggregata]|uniref:LysR family transcriptional regulator n=1 Tax=Candidatus Sororendozoicomonas aggregata TaxID=3073239 RepID=UPI002ED5DEF5
MHITLRQLEIFKAVAQCGRVTAAAEVLFISQPAASMALGELEKHLGPLFDRHQGASLSLNDAGRALLPKACELLDRAVEIEQQFNRDNFYQKGVLKIDSSSTIGNNIMPRIIGNFTEEYPGIRIDLMVGNSRHIVQRILDFDIDMALVEGICLHPDIDVTTWCDDELVIICSPLHRLANKSCIALAELADEPWLLRESGSGTREVFKEMIVAKIGAPKIKMELNRTEAIKQATADGYGLACISRLSVCREIESGSLATIKVDDLSLKRNFYLIRHKSKYISRVLQTFSSYLLSC